MRRDLGLIVSGVGVSAFGTCLSQLVLLLHFKTVGPVVVAAFLVAASLPVSLGAPLAGLLVDRLPNRRLMQAAQLLQAAMMITVAVALDNTVLVITAMFVHGCGTAVADPAASALVPHATEDATRGYSWLATARSVGLVVGTGAGGVIAATIGVHAAILVDAATFVAQALSLLLLTVERRGGTHDKRGGALEGFKYLWRDRVLAAGVGGNAVIALCVVLINVADLFYIIDVLHGGIALVGWVYAVWMAGAVIGARIAGRAVRLVRVLGLGGVLMGSMIALAAAVPVTAVVFVAFLLGGVGLSVTNVARQALVRQRSPEELLGRVFAASDSAQRTAYVVATLAGGLLVGGIGSQLTMIIAGTGALLAGGLVIIQARETARVI